MHIINDDVNDDGLFLLEKIQFIPLVVMRASLRPQKRDHISAFNTRTNRKVLHLRKCAEALLKELENKKSDETNEDSDEDEKNNVLKKRRTQVEVLAAEVALKAIRRAREGDLPRKLIDQQNYCLRCGFPLRKEEEDQKKKSNANENNNNSDNNRRMNCSCCGYKVSSSIHAKKKKKKKTKKRRIL